MNGMKNQTQRGNPCGLFVSLFGVCVCVCAFSRRLWGEKKYIPHKGFSVYDYARQVLEVDLPACCSGIYQTEKFFLSIKQVL